MRFYQKLSQIKFLKRSYAFKFLFVAFVGIHIPLIGILFFVLFDDNNLNPLSILIFSLIMTLLATAITLLLLNKLIKPISIASQSLEKYRSSRILSTLPTNYKDEAGLLMRNIQESIYEAETFRQEKQDLIFMLSHDLKNFAGNPQGLAKLIINETTSDSIRHMAELICQSTDLQFRYIENFIKLLKEQDEISRIVHEPRLLYFQDIVSTATEQVSQRLLQKNITLQTNLEVDKELLNIDEGFMAQVLVNLVVNAIKFSYQDGTVKLRNFKENGILYFTISDNGMGFDKMHKEEIFKKFTKMSKLGTENESSTGLGLYLCKKIIERHGGKLYATSEGKNKGAVFTIEFEL
ncbi:sensor histidine kinase [Flavobacterium agrisoli]|uniref:histidine kinase n=1 Tax=Flavobacterium agrisoli TaxID=2793066 RepID=A0A934UIH5_9FLAO|nr:HAMP domain-containing sensor histidine kinase [Flavobacterium agrisoli]MBK0368866.1 HAMP domain-containing histidine kinase [Flavobacterium agrisoli]